MIPQVDNLFEFNEDVAKIEIPSKTYKLNAEDELLYFDDYLLNITFEIDSGNLIEHIKQTPALIEFSIVDGYLVASTIEE